MEEEIFKAFLDGNLKEYIEKREQAINRRWFWFLVFVLTIFIGFFCLNYTPKQDYRNATFKDLKNAANSDIWEK